MSDFGKWFEAAEHAAARIILEANAAQPDSAPASKDVAASNAERFPAGMGVDLVEKLCASIARATADSIETPESAYDWGASDAKRALLARIESLERDAAQYAELIFAVGRKYDGETRQQTALRYIRQAEAGNNIAARKEGK